MIPQNAQMGLAISRTSLAPIHAMESLRCCQSPTPAGPFPGCQFDGKGVQQFQQFFQAPVETTHSLSTPFTKDDHFATKAHDAYPGAAQVLRHADASLESLHVFLIVRVAHRSLVHAHAHKL